MPIAAPRAGSRRAARSVSPRRSLRRRWSRGGSSRAGGSESPRRSPLRTWRPAPAVRPMVREAAAPGSRSGRQRARVQRLEDAVADPDARAASASRRRRGRWPRAPRPLEPRAPAPAAHASARRVVLRSLCSPGLCSPGLCSPGLCSPGLVPGAARAASPDRSARSRPPPARPSPCSLRRAGRGAATRAARRARPPSTQSRTRPAAPRHRRRAPLIHSTRLLSPRRYDCAPGQRVPARGHEERRAARMTSQPESRSPPASMSAGEEQRSRFARVSDRPG